MKKILQILMLGTIALSPTGDRGKPFVSGFNFMPYKNKDAEKAYRQRPDIVEKNAKYHKEYKQKNRDKVNANMRRWISENRDSVSGYMLKGRYGISKKEYDVLFLSQNGCCAICSSHQSLFKKRLHVDHCHETGSIRGLLCVNCNTAIGHFKEDYLLIEEAIVTDENLLSVDSKKGKSKFCSNIQFMKNAIKYLECTKPKQPAGFAAMKI